MNSLINKLTSSVLTGAIWSALFFGALFVSALMGITSTPFHDEYEMFLVAVGILGFVVKLNKLTKSDE